MTMAGTRRVPAIVIYVYATRIPTCASECVVAIHRKLDQKEIRAVFASQKPPLFSKPNPLPLHYLSTKPFIYTDFTRLNMRRIMCVHTRRSYSSTCVCSWGSTLHTCLGAMLLAWCVFHPDYYFLVSQL